MLLELHLIYVMPKLYEYLGISIFFYSNEHEPVHVHGHDQGRESKFEILIQNGEIKGIRSKTVRGRKTLDRVQQQLLQEFVEAYAEQIVQRWIDYFVYNREIATEIINQRVK